MTEPDQRLFSEACERNREPIAAVLRTFVPHGSFVLEIGSGSGQHAAHLSGALPGVTWQPCDRSKETLASVRAWTSELPNVRKPIVFDLFEASPPVAHADVVVCINVIHIAAWEATRKLFEHAATVLEPGGFLYLYGPFRYQGRPLEPSNERFDQWLRNRDPVSGIRTFEEVDALAQAHGFELRDDVAMPANNRSIYWVRVSER